MIVAVKHCVSKIYLTNQFSYIEFFCVVVNVFINFILKTDKKQGETLTPIFFKNYTSG